MRGRGGQNDDLLPSTYTSTCDPTLSSLAFNQYKCADAHLCWGRGGGGWRPKVSLRSVDPSFIFLHNTMKEVASVIKSLKPGYNDSDQVVRYSDWSTENIIQKLRKLKGDTTTGTCRVGVYTVHCISSCKIKKVLIDHKKHKR